MLCALGPTMQLVRKRLTLGTIWRLSLHVHNSCLLNNYKITSGLRTAEINAVNNYCYYNHP